MNHFPNFAKFVAHSRLAMKAFHGQLLEEPRLTDQDRQSYRVMLAALALGWLDRVGDVRSLARLRDQINEALMERANQRSLKWQRPN